MPEASAQESEGRPPSLSEVSTSQIPLSKLDASTTKEGEIAAVVSLLWPFSESASTLSLQLCEEDFRASQGDSSSEQHLKVTFSGVAAEKMKSVEIGDRITISLDGASWEKLEDAEDYDLPWHLRWEQWLKVKVFDSNKNVKIDVDGEFPETTSSQALEAIAAISDLESQSTGSRDTQQDLKRRADDEWDAPLNFYDPFFLSNAADTLTDIEDDSSYASSEPVRKKARFDNSQDFRLVSKSISPEREQVQQSQQATVSDMEVEIFVPEMDINPLAPAPISQNLRRQDMPPPPPPPPSLPLLSTNVPDSQKRKGSFPLAPEIRPTPSPSLPLVSPFPDLSGESGFEGFSGVGQVFPKPGRKDSEFSESTDFDLDEVDEAILAQVESSVSAMIESESVAEHSGDEQTTGPTENEGNEDVGSVGPANDGDDEATPRNENSEDRDSLFGSDDEDEQEDGKEEEDVAGNLTPSKESENTRSAGPANKQANSEDSVLPDTGATASNDHSPPGNRASTTSPSQNRLQKAFQATGAGSPFPSKLQSSLPTPVSPSGVRRGSFAGLSGIRTDVNLITPLRRSSVAIPNSLLKDGQMSPVTPSRLFLPEPTPTEDKKGFFSWLQESHNHDKEPPNLKRSHGEADHDRLPPSLKISHSYSFPIRADKSPLAFDRNNAAPGKAHFRPQLNARAALELNCSDEESDSSGDESDGFDEASIKTLHERLDEYAKKANIKAGIITPLSEFVALGDLSKAWGSTVDLLAVNIRSSTISRATSGPQDYYTTLRIIDPSNTKGITITIFRPYKDALPVVNPGDVVLLRSFRIQSQRHQIVGISTNCSAWGVWRKKSQDWSPGSPTTDSSSDKERWTRNIVKGNGGPDVEFEDEELAYIEKLGNFWDNMPLSLNQELIREPNEDPRKRKADGGPETPRKRRLTFA